MQSEDPVLAPARSVGLVEVVVLTVAPVIVAVGVGHLPLVVLENPSVVRSVASRVVVASL